MDVIELKTEDASAVRRLYDDFEVWAGRSNEEVREALSNTPLALGVDDDELVTAARVLTDFVFYAKVYDVIVAADRRNRGYGERLMGAVVDHPRLSDVDVVDLRCREGLVPFYESVGFEVYDATAEVDGREEQFVKMNFER